MSINEVAVQSNGFQEFFFHTCSPSSKISFPKIGRRFFTSSVTKATASRAVWRCAEEAKTKKQSSPALIMPWLWCTWPANDRASFAVSTL